MAVECVDSGNMESPRGEEAADQVPIAGRIARRWIVKRKLGDNLILWEISN